MLFRPYRLAAAIASAAITTVVVPNVAASQQASVQLNELSVEGTAERPIAVPNSGPTIGNGVGTSGSPRGVVPAYAGGQVAQGGRLGVLGNVENKKSPFSVSSYTDKLIRDEQANTVSEALILDPSVRATQTTGAPFDSFYIRGFPYNEGTSGEIAFDGLYGVAPSFRVFTDYAERIEVLKGPSAALSGVAPNGGIGGVINVVPKRAYDDLTRVTFDYNSVARGGSGFDVARRYGTAREWGVRLVGSVRGGDTPFDRQSELTGVGALAVDYQGDRLRAWLYVLGQTDSFTAPLRPYLLSAGLAVPKAPSGQLNVTQPWEYSNVYDRGGLLRTEYDLTNDVTVFADVGGSRTDVDRYFTSAPTILNARGDTSSNPQFYGLGIDRSTYDGGVRAKFDTGFIHHAFVVQGSAYNEDTGRFLSTGSGTYRSNIYAPAFLPYRSVTVSDARPRLSDSTLTGISVADTLSVLDEHILLTLAGRQQNIEAHNYTSNTGVLTSSYDKSALTPLFGLVLRPNDNVSVYANYIEGLSRGDVAPATATNSGTILAPYIARQIEAGLKLDFGTFGTGFSAFQIDRPIGELSPARFYAQTGLQRVSGVELSAYGQILPEVRVVGGLSLLDGVLTKTALAANVGNTPIGVPKVQLNVGAEWDLPWVLGLTLNGAVVYTSRQFVDTANKQALPDWARLDLGVRYTTLIEGTRTTFRANVVNVTGVNYWTGVASFGTFFQGAPRTYLLSMTVDM